jgi:hypothetical protein
MVLLMLGCACMQDQLREQLEGSVEPEQTVYLMGEGFGALLALAAAAECRCVLRTLRHNTTHLAAALQTCPCTRPRLH